MTGMMRGPGTVRTGEKPKDHRWSDTGRDIRPRWTHPNGSCDGDAWDRGLRSKVNDHRMGSSEKGRRMTRPQALVQKTVVRVLQQAGYVVAKGDAARVIEALGGGSPRPGRITEIAERLGLTKAMPARTRQVVLQEAWSTIAAALPMEVEPVQIGGVRNSIGRALRSMLLASDRGGSPRRFAGCESLRRRIADESALMPVLDELYFTAQTGSLVREAQEVITAHIWACLRETLRQRADDLVNDLPDEHIDALARYASFDAAAEAIGPYLYDGRSEKGAFVRVLRMCFDMPTGEFFRLHVPYGSELHARIIAERRQVA